MAQGGVHVTETEGGVECLWLGCQGMPVQWKLVSERSLQHCKPLLNYTSRCNVRGKQ